MPRATKLQQGKNGKLASKRSKTGDPKCSAAASAFARGQATSDTYKILGECRSRARMKGQANLQREAGNEAKAQVLEKRAERGMTGKDRLAKAKELVAARKAKIDARVQAKAAPAKPDRLARLGATDPKVKAMLAERRSARAAELRQQRAAKAAPAPAAARPSRSTPERQARVEAAKDRLFGRRLDRAFTKLEGPKGDNFQGLDKVRAALPYRSQEFESRLTAQRKQGRYSLASYEGTAGPMSDSLRAASIQNGTSILSYVSRRDAEPYTPRKAKAAPASPSLPAIKSGPPTIKGGVPAETPKRSLLEQASIRRAAKEAAAAMQGTTRAGQLAGRAKRKYDAAKRNAAANIKKAKEQGAGSKAAEKAEKYVRSMNVNSGRYVDLYNSWATGGKFAKARVVN